MAKDLGSAYAGFLEAPEVLVPAAAAGATLSGFLDYVLGVTLRQLFEEYLKSVVETRQQMTIDALEQMIRALYVHDPETIRKLFVPREPGGPGEPEPFVIPPWQKRHRLGKLLNVLATRTPPGPAEPQPLGPPLPKPFRPQEAFPPGPAEPLLPMGSAMDVVTEALTMTHEHMAPVKDAIAGGFNATGHATAEAIPIKTVPPGLRFKLQFDVRNPRAEQWLHTESSTLVQEIIDDQRVMIRQYLTDALAVGKGPRNTALDLVGRINPQSGLREGGVVGLHSIQARWVSNYEREIASTDPAMLAKALLRGLRDKRFDRSVQRAISTGQPIPPEQRVKMRMAYANNALRYRGENIARTETARAIGAAQHEAYQQAIDRKILEQRHMRRFWVTAGDERVRADHRRIPAMNKNGVAWNEPFQTPTGPSMHAPHDRDINCRCMERVRIDWRGLRRAQGEAEARAA